MVVAFPYYKVKPTRTRRKPCAVVPIHDPDCDVNPATMTWREDACFFHVCERCIKKIIAASKGEFGG